MGQKFSVLADITRRNAQGDNPAIVPLRRLEFKITDKIICSSCYFIKRKRHKTFRTTKIRI